MLANLTVSMLESMQKSWQIEQDLRLVHGRKRPFCNGAALQVVAQEVQRFCSQDCQLTSVLCLNESLCISVRYVEDMHFQ